MTRVAWHIVRPVLLALAGTILLFAILVLPPLYQLVVSLIPQRILLWWVEEWSLVLVLVYVITRRSLAARPEAGRFAKQARRGLAWIDLLLERAWDGGLVLAVSLVCVGFLAAWVPHYLTWPWSRDEDSFSVFALSWDRGILPYRDIAAFNFPGQPFLFWGLGKLFGWGRTIPFYVFDASCVVALGGVMVAWSRRKLQGALPGLVGYFAFLGVYLNLAFENTGERDWQTAFLLCVGLMITQAWPGRWSRIASAAMAAAALSIRPHAVFFLPALAAANMEPRPTSELVPFARRRAALEWLLWLGVFLAAAFAPLIAAGIIGDWLRGFRIAAYGGPYSTITPASAIKIFLNQFLDWRTDVPLAATLLLAMTSTAGLGRVARIWSLAWIGVLLYMPVHPVHHGYLVLPVVLVRSITWALVISWLVSVRRLARPLRVVAVVLVAYELVPGPPCMCSLQAAHRRCGCWLVERCRPRLHSAVFSRSRNRPGGTSIVRSWATFAVQPAPRPTSPTS